jgi:hypothetical protein
MRAQVAGCLPSKPNVLIHTPVLAKKKKRKKKKECIIISTTFYQK